MMRKTIHWIRIGGLALMLLLSACSPAASPTQSAVPTQSAAAVLPATAAPSATAVPSAAAAGSAAASANQAAAPASTTTATAVIPNSGAASTSGAAAGSGTQSAPAVSCTSPAALTPAMTEGPYFKQGSPEQSNLVQQGMSGTQLTLTGYVLDTNCQPIANALLDFWQADAQGQYDNSGYTLRGHVFTDASGRYQVETVIPGLYPGRTEHIHVKVQPPNGQVLTTQLFFPGVAQNQSDQIFDQRLLLNMQDAQGGKVATYTFIVNP